MTLQDLKVLFDHALSMESKAERRAVFQHWCGKRLDLSAAAILLHAERPLTEEEQQQAQDDLAALKRGLPLQYILAETYWYGMPLKVTSDTLIPRPETEALMADLAQEITQVPQRILDVGTGSGCIALAMKTIFPKAQVTGIDVSEAALSVAQENGRSLAQQVEWRKLDLQDALDKLPGPWHLIVSNPPYIAEAEKLGMAIQVRDHEPAEALFVPDEDPLYFYRLLAEFAGAALSPQGLLAVEINQSYGAETLSLFRKRGFQAQLRQDQFGNDRFIWVRPK